MKRTNETNAGWTSETDDQRLHGRPCVRPYGSAGPSVLCPARARSLARSRRLYYFRLDLNVSCISSSLWPLSVVDARSIRRPVWSTDVQWHRFVRNCDRPKPSRPRNDNRARNPNVRSLLPRHRPVGTFPDIYFCCSGEHVRFAEVRVDKTAAGNSAAAAAVRPRWNFGRFVCAARTCTRAELSGSVYLTIERNAPR